MTVREHCKYLLWSISDLAREAGISWQAAQRAFNGETIQARTRRDICKAFSSALHREVSEKEIAWGK